MKNTLRFFAVSSISFVAPLALFAQTIQNPLRVSSLSAIVSAAMTLVVRVGGVVAVIAFIIAGYKFVVAQGKPEELKKAKDIFFYTVVGVAILLGAQLIASIVVGTVKGLGN